MEQRSVCGKNFIDMIGIHEFENSFQTKPNNVESVTVSSEKSIGDYNVQLFDEKWKMIESKRIRKNGDIGTIIESRLFD